MRVSVVGLLLCFLIAKVPAAEPTGLFQPYATIDQDPACAAMVESARRNFLSDVSSRSAVIPAKKIQNLVMLPNTGLNPVYVGEIEGSHGRSARRYDLSTSVRPRFLFLVDTPGCGGGCERMDAVISAAPDASGPIRTDTMLEWNIYRAGEAYYLLGYDEDRQTLYRLSDERPAPVCQVVLNIPREKLLERPAVKPVADVVDRYANAVLRIQGGDGNCGSLRTRGRLRNNLRNSFNELFYRPWALTAGAVVPVEFRAWSLQGIAEFEAFAAEERAFADAQRALADLYTVDFKLSATEGQRLAGSALRSAAATGFSFPKVDYESRTDRNPEFFAYNSPFPEGSDARLRRAILERRPISEISKIETTLEIIDGGVAGESILNVAVRYPEALAWLLEHGANPNVSNAFGKTPLMYAAQFGELRSVELLLDHGAYANATTKEPGDSCYYTFSNHGLGALHYAARFAGAPVIRRLVTAGAFPFLAAARKPVYPLDSLQEYGDADRVSALNGDERAALVLDLTPVDKAARETLAARLAQRGAQLYRAGKMEAAYQAARDATLAADPSAAALADYALIALRAGHVLDSLIASRSVIDTTQDSKLRAAGWFNLALACEQRERAPLDPTYRYCGIDVLLMFLEAWSEAPTPARARKFVEVLDARRPHCRANAPDGTHEDYFLVRSSAEPGGTDRSTQRILVRHARNSAVPPDVFEYEQYRGRPEHQVRRTTLDQRHDFRDFSLTVLKADGYVQGEVRIREQNCQIR
jgi:hypothetical protein